ncbi:hypothetical protein ACIPM0_09625 [Pseudomonas sichuanensis]|uniref:hypothetical protein n=1 Tax=Pseudomonas sichuanensis TaxID=2213015 RepID=UPI00381C7FC6
MHLRRYLLQINPVLSTPEAARRLLRLFAIVLAIGILSGVYNVLVFTFNNELSQRRGYMSSAIAEAHTFFTNRQALLESLSLTAVRTPLQTLASTPMPENEETHLLLGSDPTHVWNFWLTRRLGDYLQEKKLGLLYVNTGEQPGIRWLYNVSSLPPGLPPGVLEQLRALDARSAAVNELWLSDQAGKRPHMTNEPSDLDYDPHYPRTPQQGGYVPRIGRHGLVDLLQEWREAGLNHAALGVQMARRPAREVIQELAEEVLPLFPASPGPKPHVQVW